MYSTVCTIDCIEQKNHPLYLRALNKNDGRVNDEEVDNETTTEDENNTTLPTRPPHHSSTPYKVGTSDGVIRYLDESGRECSITVNTTASSHHFSPPTNWKTVDPWVDKYVDDVNGGQCHLTAEGTSHITERKEIKEVHAKQCQEIYETVVENAERICMKVNPRKTKLLCISSALNYDVESYIYVGDDKLKSQETIKILGYTFGSRPGVGDHVKTLRKEYATKAWAIRNLKRAKIKPTSLVMIYCSLLRSSIEYAVPVYAHFLTNEQSQIIERLQMQTLKTIFGFELSYRECIEKSGLERLDTRRERLVKNFAIKTSENPRWSNWFPLQKSPTYDLRRPKKFREEFAAKERLRISPIFAMRRILNEL